MKRKYLELRRAIARCDTIIYDKKTRTEVKPLAKNFVNSMINKVCTRQLAASRRPDDNETPTVEIVLGYPGAGKSDIERQLLKKYNGNLVSADFDEFRPYDKRVFGAIKENPLVADYYCQLPLALRDNMLFRAADAQRHVLISTPCIDINEHPKNSVTAIFGKKGYDINITYVTANKHLCCLSNITRYFQARRNNLDCPEEQLLIPRLVSFHDHDFLCGETQKKIAFITDALEKGSDITMRVVDRNGNQLCDSSDYHRIPHVIKEKEKRPLTADEEKRLAYELDFITESIMMLGLCKKEKQILSDFFNGRLINHQSFANNNHYYGRFNPGSER